MTQNTYDAIFDLCWNGGSGSLDYEATKLLATGNLDDETVLAKLQKEILETAHAELKNESTGELENVWVKNLVERRLDTVRIAQGGTSAYTKNEIKTEEWNNLARKMLLDYGLDEKTVDKYHFQKIEQN